MRLIAKCTIYGADNAVTKPGETFECDETEGKGLIAQGFAEEAEAPAKPMTKAEKAAADKAAKEAAEAEAKAAKEAEDAAAKAAADEAAKLANGGGNE